MAQIGNEEIAKRFGYHRGTEETMPKHRVVRNRFAELARTLDDILPAGRAKNVAFKELEDASMWANKAIAEQAPVVDE